MKKKCLRVLITILVVILGISGIGWLTWNLGQVFVGLAANSDFGDEKNKGDISSGLLALPQISFWTCQVGVYQDRKNADFMVKALQSKGWKAGLIKEEPYTIAIGVYDSKENAVLQGDVLQKDGIEAWIRKEEFPPLSFKVSGKNVEKTVFLLEAANYLLAGKERNEVKAELAGDMVFSEGGCPPDFQKINNTLSKILRTDYESEKTKNHYSLDLLALYLDYKLITTKYLKNYNY